MKRKKVMNSIKYWYFVLPLILIFGFNSKDSIAQEDGGGSTSTVIDDTLITKKIDKHGTKERLRPNFLYFE